MKKTYLAPEMETVEILTQQMLASSIVLGDPGSADDAEAPIFDDLILYYD